MLMLDTVPFIVPMKECTAKKNFSYNEWFFPAHFPNNPIVPGSVQIEAYTQAVGVTLLASKNNKNNYADLLLVSVDRVRFYKSIVPGDNLSIKVIVEKVSMGMATASVRGYLGTELVSECKIGYKMKDVKDG